MPHIKLFSTRSAAAACEQAYSPVSCLSASFCCRVRPWRCLPDLAAVSTFAMRRGSLEASLGRAPARYQLQRTADRKHNRPLCLACALMEPSEDGNILTDSRIGK